MTDKIKVELDSELARNFAERWGSPSFDGTVLGRMAKAVKDALPTYPNGTLAEIFLKGSYHTFRGLRGTGGWYVVDMTDRQDNHVRFRYDHEVASAIVTQAVTA